MSTDSLLVPLSQLDHGYLEKLCMTIGYVVKSVDESALQAAATRVVDKWRLLAGRVVWSKKLSSWCILVPLKGDVSNRLTFTVTTLTTRLDSSFVINDSLSAQLLQRPPFEYFCHPSAQMPIGVCSSSGSPIISIHVTQLSNCVCIGINCPHGVFDAVGLGQFIHALDNELNGRPWEVPSFPLSGPETNVLQEALDDLEALPSMYDDIHRESTMYDSFRRELVKFSLFNGLALYRHTLNEYFWGSVEAKVVYLKGETLGKLLRDVKEEVKSIDNELKVSTSDILVAWFLKAMYAKEMSNTKPVSLSSLISVRNTLEKKYPAMKGYSRAYIPSFSLNKKADLQMRIDNAIMFCYLPTLMKQQLNEMSVAQLAILQRQVVELAADEAWIQGFNRYLRRGLKGNMCFRRRGRNDEPYLFTNQVIARFDQIDFGSKTYGVFPFLKPLEPARIIVLNKFKDGYLILANARSSSWRSVMDAVEKLQPISLKAHL